MIKALFLRDLFFIWCQKTSLLINLLFFFAFALIIGFFIGSEPLILKKIAPSLLWIAAIFTLFLHLDLLFKPDHQNGSLEQFFLGQNFLQKFKILQVKMFAHWLTHILPLILMTPLMGSLFYLPFHQTIWTMLCLMLGTLPLTALGLFAAMITVSLENSVILTSLIMIPFACPILIFAITTNLALIAQTAYLPSLCFLFALIGFYLILWPIAALCTLTHLYLKP